MRDCPIPMSRVNSCTVNSPARSTAVRRIRQGSDRALKVSIIISKFLIYINQLLLIYQLIQNISSTKKAAWKMQLDFCFEPNPDKQDKCVYEVIFCLPR